MHPRLETQDDDEGRDVEELYGKPQHETRRGTNEQELYGDPQHDVTDDRSPSEFDPDFGHVLDRLDHPVSSGPRTRWSTRDRPIRPTERP